jgi:hypothetical protein
MSRRRWRRCFDSIVNVFTKIRHFLVKVVLVLVRLVLEINDDRSVSDIACLRGVLTLRLCLFLFLLWPASLEERRVMADACVFMRSEDCSPSVIEGVCESTV